MGFFLAAFNPTTIPAQTTSPTAAPTKKRWSGQTSIGYSNSDGNVDRESFRMVYELKYVVGKNDLVFDGELINFKNQGVSIEQMYELNLMDWYHFTKKAGVYAKLTYYENKYRGFDEQWKAGTGLTYAFITGTNILLASRIGYQARKTAVTGIRATDYNNGFHQFVLAGLMFNHPLFQNVTFRSKADIEVDMKRTANYYLFTTASLDLKVNPWLSTLVSYRVERSGIPVEGRKDTDSIFDVSFSFKF